MPVKQGLVGRSRNGGENDLTVGIVVATEADHHEAFFFGEDGLVNMPGSS